MVLGIPAKFWNNHEANTATEIIGKPELKAEKLAEKPSLTEKLAEGAET